MAGLTITDIQKETGVNIGQISRFERGDFKRVSKNLQKINTFLQKKPISTQGRLSSADLGDRLEKLASRSEKHRVAAEAVLRAFEQFIDNSGP